MTPQEKAKELYHKHFSMITIESPIDRVSSIPYVKKCSLIAIDEILDVIDKNNITTWDHEIFKYWFEVKLEMQAL